jgi:hypothetical protein
MICLASSSVQLYSVNALDDKPGLMNFLYFFQALFFGGQDSLPWILARHQLPWFGIIIDPCAAALVCVVTVLLCMGIKEVTTLIDS